jgi:hypothetical protein
MTTTQTRFRSPKLLALSIGLISLTGLSACQKSDRETVVVGPSPLAKSAQAMAAAKSQMMDVKVMMDISGQGQNIKGSMGFAGYTESSGEKGQFNLDMSDIFKKLSEELGSDALDPDQMKIEFRIDSPKIWFKSKLITAGAPEGKTWVQADIADLGLKPEEMLQDMAMGVNPTQGLTFLEAANAEGVKEEGKETIRGVETTHYSAKMDPRKAIELGGSGTKSALEGIQGDIVPVDVWIDADGLTRRMSYGFEVKKDSMNGKMDFVIEYFDFNKTMAITPPPADETVNINDVPGLKESMKKKDN